MIKVQGKIIKTEPIQGNLIDNIEGLIKVQEKTVTPIEETQDIIPDSSYDALSKVTVNKIPDDYIIPEGTLEITTNNLYNVKNYEKASVNIELRLAEKTITTNGVYDALDDSVDGYSQVTVDIPSKFPSLVDGTITTITADDLEGAIKIRSKLFYYDSNIMSVEIPSSVLTVESDAFYSCSKLSHIEIQEGLQEIKSAAFYASKITQLILPDSLLTIRDTVFRQSVNLSTLIIGSNITRIERAAFFSCTALTSITIKATNPPILEHASAFNDTNNCPIYVPAESVNAYKAASNWVGFASRIQAIPE